MKMNLNDETTATVDWDEVDRVLVAFENAYSKTGHADVQDFAPALTNPNCIPITQELIRVALELSWSRGNPKPLDDYRADFPHIFQHTPSLIAIAYEEFRLKKQAGYDVTPQDYADRYDISVTEWERRSEPVEDSVRVPALVHRLLGSIAESTDKPSEEPFLFEDFPQLGDQFLSFRLVRELGRGAFARVYYAEQRDMANRPVALKISAQHRQESQTLARLQHTNIVPIYSTHAAGRFTAICMPYFGATTLDDVLRRLRANHSLPQSSEGILSTVIEAKAPSTITEVAPSPEAAATVALPNSTPIEQLRSFTHVEAVLWIGAELAEGLAFAHDAGVIHRDLKPANVLLADDGRPMLLDFNLATGKLELRNKVGGTPSHMAAEQLTELLGEQTIVDNRCDIYSLGLVLYELLTGRLPTAVPTGAFNERLVALRADRLQPAPPAAPHNPAVTPAVDSILAKCLAPRPEDRYQSAKHLAEDIRCQLSNLPLRHAAEGAIWERRRKFVRRNPWLRSLPFLVLVVGIALGAAVYGVFSAIRHRERSEMLERYQTLMPRVNALRMRLSVPDLDPKRLEADVQEGVELVSSPGIRDSILDPISRTKLRWQFADLSTLLAHAEAELGTRITDDSSRMISALAWNQRAFEIAENEEQKWSIQQQRVSFLERLGRMAEAQALRTTLGTRNDVTGSLHAFRDAFERGELRESIAILAKQNPAQIGMTGWFGRGRAHARLGEHAEAVAAFTTAMALQSGENYRLYVHRANSYVELRNYRDAVRDFSSAIEQRPGDAALYVSRAIVRHDLKEADGALTDLEKALELEPTLTRAYFVRRQVLLQMGQRAAAEKALEEGLRQTPGDELSWVTRGVHKLARKNATGAIADFDEALKLNRQSRLALQNKANALSEQLGKPAESIQVLGELLKYHPESQAARAGRGVLLARQGDRISAHRDAEAVLRSEPSPMMQYQIAGIYALTSQTHPDDVKQALRLLAKAFKSGVNSAIVKTDPDLDPIRNNPDFVRLLAAVRAIDNAGRGD